MTGTVKALGGHDDHTAFGDNPGGDIDAFHHLVQVPVQRVTVIACDHDIGRMDLDGHGLFDKRAALQMGIGRMPCKCADDFLFFIECDIEDESESCHPGGFGALRMDGVAFEIGAAGMFIGDIGGTVIVHDGLRACDPRQDAFPSSAESREEVRSIKPSEMTRSLSAIRLFRYNSFPERIFPKQVS